MLPFLAALIFLAASSSRAVDGFELKTPSPGQSTIPDIEYTRRLEDGRALLQDKDLARDEMQRLKMTGQGDDDDAILYGVVIGGAVVLLIVVLVAARNT